MLDVGLWRGSEDGRGHVGLSYKAREESLREGRRGKEREGEGGREREGEGGRGREGEGGR